MPILADDMSKFFAIAVIAIIWGIGAIMSAVKKANEEAARRRARMPIAPRPPAIPPARFGLHQPAGGRGQTAASIALAQQARALAQMTSRPTPPAFPQRRRVIPAPPPLRQPAPPPLRAPAAPPTARPAARPAAAVEQTPQAHRTAPIAVGAQSIRRWLRPGVLRRQFILTELLQPPIALRENGD
jgi:hypothetical protein